MPMNNNTKYTPTQSVQTLLGKDPKSLFYRYFTDNNDADYTKDQLDKDFNSTWNNGNYPLVENLDTPVLQYYLTVLEYKILPYFPKYKFNMESFMNDFDAALRDNTFAASKFSNNFENPPPISSYAKGLINTLLIKVVYDKALLYYAELQGYTNSTEADI